MATEKVTIEVRGYTLRRLLAAATETSKNYDELVCNGLTALGVGFPNPVVLRQDRPEETLCEAPHILADGRVVFCRRYVSPHLGTDHRWWTSNGQSESWP